MLPIYTRYLSPADYGVAALVEMTLDVISIIAGAQIAQGIFRFYHKADSDADRRAVIATTLTALVASFTLMAAAVLLSAPALSRLVFGSPVHADLVRLAAGSFALQSLTLVAMSFGRVQERAGFVVSANVVRLLIQVSLNLVFIVGMQIGVRGVFLSTFCTNLVMGLWLGIWTIRQVGLGIRLDILRSIVRYGVPLMGVQAATFTMTFSDRYFLQAAGDETMVGLYNLAYQFGFLLLMLGFVPIEMVWGPRRFQVARSANPSPVLARAFRLINVSVMTIGVGIALFVGDLLRIMSTPPFHPAADTVPIILVAYVFHGWAMMHDIGVLVVERTEFLTLANWVAAGVALAAFTILIPRFYLTGAAVGAIFGFGVRWAMTYHFSQRLWRVEYDWPPIRRLAIVAGAVIIASNLLPPLPLLISISANLLLLGVYGALLWSVRIMTTDEKRAGVEIARRITAQATSRLKRLAFGSGSA